MPSVRVFKHILAYSIAFLALAFPVFAFAQGGFTPLAPLPGITDSADLSGFLNAAFKLGLAIAGTLAVVMITVGGLEYMTTESISGKGEGRTRIWNAVVGLLIALLIWIILFEINPNLLSLDFGRNLNQLEGVRERVEAPEREGAESYDDVKQTLTGANADKKTKAEKREEISTGRTAIMNISGESSRYHQEFRDECTKEGGSIVSSGRPGTNWLHTCYVAPSSN